MNSPNRKTVSGISRDWSRALRASQKPPVWDLGNLLDDFRCHCMTPEEKLAIVSDPPEPTGEPETDAYLAAMVETLCREAAIAPPAWTEGPSTFMSKPWFASGLQSLNAITSRRSPRRLPASQPFRLRQCTPSSLGSPLLVRSQSSAKTNFNHE